MSFGTCAGHYYRDVLSKSQLSSCTGSWDIAVETWGLVLCFRVLTGIEPSIHYERTRRPNCMKFELHLHEYCTSNVSKAGVAGPSRSRDIHDWSYKTRTGDFLGARQNGTVWRLHLNNFQTSRNKQMPLGRQVHRITLKMCAKFQHSEMKRLDFESFWMSSRLSRRKHSCNC